MSNPYKYVEQCAHQHHLSHSPITDGSYIAFLQDLLKRKEYKLLSAGRFACVVSMRCDTLDKDILQSRINNLVENFNKASSCNVYVRHRNSSISLLIVGSLRCLYESNLDDKKYKIEVAILNAVRNELELKYKLTAEHTYEFDIEYEFDLHSPYNTYVVSDICQDL